MLHGTLQTQATQKAPARRGTGVAWFACVLFLGQSAGILAMSVAVDRGLASLAIGTCRRRAHPPRDDRRARREGSRICDTLPAMKIKHAEVHAALCGACFGVPEYGSDWQLWRDQIRAADVASGSIQRELL
jgi:hypothetical protein